MTVCRWADVHKANKLMNQMGQKNAPLVMSSVTDNCYLGQILIALISGDIQTISARRP